MSHFGIGNRGKGLTPKFKIGQDFCTMHLAAKFHHPTFNSSEIIMLTNNITNKQMPLKTSNLIRYAMPIGKNSATYFFHCQTAEPTRVWGNECNNSIKRKVTFLDFQKKNAKNVRDQLNQTTSICLHSAMAKVMLGDHGKWKLNYWTRYLVFSSLSGVVNLVWTTEN